MSKYEELKQKIIEAVPEIMELKFGCEVEVCIGEYTERMTPALKLQDGDVLKYNTIHIYCIDNHYNSHLHHNAINIT